MAETNKSQMLSEAELIEAINANTLVSISLGKGQPQKNVTLATLATVVAGIIRDEMLQVGVSINTLEGLNAGLTSSSRRVVFFATGYMSNVTGAGDNHIVGFAYSIDQSSERQIVFGIISQKWYQRSKAYSASTWTPWAVVS